MKRIVVDADGVLVDFAGGICRELQSLGFRRVPEDIKHWDLTASLPPDEMRAVSEIMTRPGFCHSLELYPGAQRFFVELQLEGDVFVATAPFDGSETWERERKAALSSFMPRKRVLPIPGEFKHLLRADVIIEDHPGTAFEFVESNPEGVAILIDRPWNGTSAKEWTCHSRMYRAHGFNDALRIVREVVCS